MDSSAVFTFNNQASCPAVCELMVQGCSTPLVNSGLHFSASPNFGLATLPALTTGNHKFCYKCDVKFLGSGSVVQTLTKEFTFNVIPDCSSAITDNQFLITDFTSGNDRILATSGDIFANNKPADCPIQTCLAMEGTCSAAAVSQDILV